MKFVVTRHWRDEVEVTARSYEDAEEKARWMEDTSELDRMDVNPA